MAKKATEREQPPSSPENSSRVMGLAPKNSEQAIAFAALLDPNIDLVTLIGKAGSGKTLLAVAAGLHLVTEKRLYERVLVARPVTPMGDDIGFIPGTVEEKMTPWMHPIYDAVERIAKANNSRSADVYMEYDQLRIEALTYIRGRSIPNQFMIIDEAQNLTPHEVKTIITRAGEGTKIILTGDPDQIDKPRLNAVNNGLSYAARKFAGQEISAHIELTDCVRSRLAALAAELL